MCTAITTELLRLAVNGFENILACRCWRFFFMSGIALVVMVAIGARVLVTTGRTIVMADDLEAHGFDPMTEAPDPDDFW